MNNELTSEERQHERQLFHKIEEMLRKQASGYTLKFYDTLVGVSNPKAPFDSINEQRVGHIVHPLPISEEEAILVHTKAAVGVIQETWIEPLLKESEENVIAICLYEVFLEIRDDSVSSFIYGGWFDIRGYCRRVEQEEGI